jgi:heme/copper-type cytochrome/quinol oxidase subunit 2
MVKLAHRRVLASAALLVVVLALSVYVILQAVPRQEWNGESVRIVMTTFNWGFNITSIPDFQFGRIYESPTLTVHEGDHVIIELRTLDVTHGLAIDEYGIHVMVLPGETVTVEFHADKVGQFRYYCNVFCGLGHASMSGILEVLPYGG